MPIDRSSFVFVVCGGKEHINTLNFSLKALRRFSNIPILIVTDLRRNEALIQHTQGQIIDVQTPTEFDNHQASIFLKTGLHRFLPMDDANYCYLDSDVIALSNQVNQVFDHFVEPITFCSDHCRVDEFSSSAVKCGCDEKPSALQDALLKYEHLYMKNEEKIAQLLREWRKSKIAIELDSALSHWYNANLTAESREQRERLLELTKPGTPPTTLLMNYLFKVLPNYRRSLFEKVWKTRSGQVLIDESLRFHQYMKSKGFVLNRKTNIWQTGNGHPVNRPFDSFDKFFKGHGYYYKRKSDRWYTLSDELFAVNRTLEVEKETGYRYIEENQVWVDKEGNTVFNNRCNHLHKAIGNQFGIRVRNRNWQHWNGGVFLFNQDSLGFMDTWHQLTLDTFSIPYWKTRDQGTLIATAWKHNLENHPLIPIEYNFIADYNHASMVYEGDCVFRLKANAGKIKPHFIHIYHHWGDSDWAVWNDVHNRVVNHI